MNVNEALERASALVIPELLLFGGDEATASQIEGNEEALRVLGAAWDDSEVPGFSFDAVRNLADSTRELVDGMDAASVRALPDGNLPRSLSLPVLAAGIAALQRRKAPTVLAELSDKRMARGAVYAKKPLGGTVLAIDIETTSRFPERGYIVNVGWEVCELAQGAEPSEKGCAYCGMPEAYAQTGVPLAEVHHITWDDIAGKTPFRLDADLQGRLLDLMCAHPYMAHNAAFEDAWFTLHLDGYAEARKAGRIRIVDSRDICRSLDPDVAHAPFSAKPAALENWAGRRGTLGAGEAERHLGADDADLMVRTVVAELSERNLLR